MRKKLLSGIIAVSACAMLLAGCGSEAQTADEQSTAVEEKAEDESMADAAAETAEEQTADEEDAEPVKEDLSYLQKDVYVQKIDGLPEDFIRGMDVSSLLSEEQSGVKYYDSDGNEADLMKILSDAGINCIRVRVWNDPFDEKGNGYGGGNCTVDTAVELGKRAAEYGIKLCVDFHYSDFWADPNKQFAPKAWDGMEPDEKESAIYDFTYESIEKILESGADLYMVQTGNEINTGMAGETDFDDITELLKSAGSAVRSAVSDYNEAEGTDRQVKIAVHYTNIDNPEGTIEVAERYSKAGLDYDVFGVSYYPYWHGTFENMTEVLSTIHETYGVDTCIMETSYMYTTGDGDDYGNSVSEDDALEDYPVSVQGQANCVRDVISAANDAGAIGVFYWEGAWIPVGFSSSENEEIWEQYGSGWASSYAAEYDADDAGKYYGGSSWDNQAFFDKYGNVLLSINVFNGIYTGLTGEETEILGVKDVEIQFAPGDELDLPAEIPAIFNDTSRTDGLAVTWDEGEAAAVTMDTPGDYTVKGYVDDGGISVSENVKKDDDGRITVTAYITVAGDNLVKNPGFEDEDSSVWTVTSNTDEDPTDIQNKAADAHSGNYAFHYWSESDMDFELAQEMTAAEDGTYKASAFMQGGDFDSSSEIVLKVTVDSDGTVTEYTSDKVVLDGWVNWKNPTITDVTVKAGDKITISVATKCCAKAWATYDDFDFSKQ